MSISVVFLVLAVLLFGFGAFSRWWRNVPDRPPYYPAFIAAGLFFWALSQLWPLLAKGS